MNERIKELAIQAGFFYEDYKDIWYLEYHNQSCEEEMKKFAELIVRRCVQVCDGNHEYKNRTDTDFGKGVSVGILMSKEQIKAHFGVEE